VRLDQVINYRDTAMVYRIFFYLALTKPLHKPAAVLFFPSHSLVVASTFSAAVSMALCYLFFWFFFHKMAQGVIGRERRELDFAEFIALVYLGGSWECFDGVTPSQTLHRP
jgi:hypothetical protein